MRICVHREDGVIDTIIKVERRQINNFDDLSAVFIEAWLLFCNEGEERLKPWTAYRGVYSNSLLDLYYEDPDPSSELWFLGGIDSIIFRRT